MSTSRPQARPKVAEKADPKLWEQIKAEFMTRKDYGGFSTIEDPSRDWNARKAQAAVKEYKRRGGTYVGKKPTVQNNSLKRWTEEDWGYIVPGSTNTRYLPVSVCQSLSQREISTETRKKRNRKGEHVSYSPSVLEKMRKLHANKRNT